MHRVGVVHRQRARAAESGKNAVAVDAAGKNLLAKKRLRRFIFDAFFHGAIPMESAFYVKPYGISPNGLMVSHAPDSRIWSVDGTQTKQTSSACAGSIFNFYRKANNLKPAGG